MALLCPSKAIFGEELAARAECRQSLENILDLDYLRQKERAIGAVLPQSSAGWRGCVIQSAFLSPLRRVLGMLRAAANFGAQRGVSRFAA